MKTITEILTAYDTDKQRDHQYGPVYDALFPEARRAEVRFVLELGIRSGGSLLAWREAFPNALIIGLDIHPPSGPLPADRVETLLGDQTDRQILRNCVSGRKFDLIVDDASHCIPHTLFSLFILWPALAARGYYVIEEFDLWEARVEAHAETFAELMPEAQLIPNAVGGEHLVVFEK
jgi:cephalosporin hydroxylase